MEERKLDINTVIGFVLLFGIMIWYFYQNQPTPEEIEAQKQAETEQVEAVKVKANESAMNVQERENDDDDDEDEDVDLLDALPPSIPSGSEPGPNDEEQAGHNQNDQTQ